MPDRLGRIVDISRLLARLSQSAPTGIDRVEFAYAQHYASKYKKGIVRFFITTPFFSGRISPFFARHVARLSLQRWSTDDEAAGNRSFAKLVRYLGQPMSAAASAPTRLVEPRSGMLDWGTSTLLFNAYYEALLSSTFQARRQREIQKRSWYLHVSHMNLHEPRRLAWIKQSGGRALFMVHDLFPISFPEYFNPEQAQVHRRRIETMARLGSLIVFNSNATKTAWDDYVRDHGLPRPPGAVALLGVDRVFLNRTPWRRASMGPPYFVVVGTTEARKNLTFLLQVWREWIRRSDVPKARLVILGRRRSDAESAVDLLERCPGLDSSIVEVAEVADIRVARLLKGSQALLAPSLVEGFGLPIAEALGLGVPVIASGIEAHREVGGASVEYLDPLDGRAWLQALDDYADSSSPRRQAALARVVAQTPRSWDEHIGAVEQLMRDASENAM